jgi:hypothetical protein
MLIHLPDIDEPFCVTESYCGDHKQNLSYNHFEIIKHGHYTSFVLMTRDQYATLVANQNIGPERTLKNHIEFNRIWDKWVEENFQGEVIKCNVTIASPEGGRFNGNLLYGFSNPDDALMFKLKWI